ncbi:sensor histidine kinase [Microbacterium sp. RD1]|uniref:sensor histidine kinase n=1 Tax=Microbacterium sp. RD1 TaxID=3457313 RepID=UPI003FA5604E
MTSRTAREKPRMPVALPFWAWCTFAGFCTLLFVSAVPVMTAVDDIDLAVSFAIATVQCGSLVLAIFRPLLGSALQFLAIVVLAVVTRSAEADIWPLPVTGLISLGALVLIVGIREWWILSLAVWWVSIVVLIALVALLADDIVPASVWGANLTIYSSYTITVLAAAIAVGQRGRIRTDLARARRDIELEHAQRLYVEERARIARELHDVVAHSMSLIHMQALSAPFRVRDAPSDVIEQEFGDIARSARTALSEMRQLLGALRSDADDSADLMPQPQLADLADLTTATSRAGTSVRVDTDPDAFLTSSLVQLTAYRVVQEALSNVIRHAPGASTAVRVSARDDAIFLSVRNAAPASAASRPQPVVDRGGQGLRGMRERVTLLGGRLSAAATPDGGYVVDAMIPAVIDRDRENS